MRFGFYNRATGAYSLTNNTDGSYNTATGYSPLYFNTEGEANTAEGFAALYKNTTGALNVANGYQALFSNTTGSSNTADGFDPGGFSSQPAQPYAPQSAKQAMLNLKIEKLQATVAQQQKQIEILTAPAQRTGSANPKSERSDRG